MTPAERIERTHWDFWWLPPDCRVVEREAITWTACDRPIGYLNSVYRLRAPASRAPALIDTVTASTPHGNHRWMIVDTWDSAPFARQLLARGFEADHDGRAVILDTHTWSPTTTPHDVRPAATLDEIRAASAVMNGGFGRPDLVTEDELLASLRTATGPGARTRRFVAWTPEGTPVAHGGLNLFPQLSIGLLWGGSTLPAHRGQGVYTALLDARIRYARAIGLRYVGMYARVDTSAPIVIAKGFHVVGEMAWLFDPAAATG